MMQQTTTRRNWLKLLVSAPLLAACSAIAERAPSATVIPATQGVRSALPAARGTSDQGAGIGSTSQPTPVLFNPLEHPLTIEAQRRQTYLGSNISIEQRLKAGATYDRFLVSYRSEGLKIYALMTVPRGTKPAGGWPAIVFNHGYIPPDEYRTTERYVAYVDGFAHHGYIVFKPDYRGHDNSEGEPRSYGYPDFTTDVLNAVVSVKNDGHANPKRIGMWGHSMGGYLTLRAMVIAKDIRAGCIWAGVVGTYAEIADLWFSRQTNGTGKDARGWRDDFFGKNGTPEMNPAFWDAISATSYLKDLSGLLQLHHADADTDVPISLSRKLNERIRAANRSVELFEYKGDNHNLSANFEKAMDRSVSFFQRYLA